MLQLVILILILQLTFTTSTTTKPYITFYWKTTSETDKVFDYWNHGPIYIPGLQNVYTLTTKAPNIFPPWLTRITTTTTERTTGLSDKKTVKITTSLTKKPTDTLTTTTKATINTGKDITQEIKTTDKQKINQDVASTMKSLTAATQRPKPIEKPKSFEELDDQHSEPFSAILMSFLKVLSVKSHSELPALFKPFASYMDELITDGDFNWLGDTVVHFARKMIEKLNKSISSPDKLHTQCYHAYNLMSKRYTDLNQDTNELLHFLDEIYDESEEEVMQIVLHEATKFPNTNSTAEEIAYSFVNNVFLIPMTRINGTVRGDVLVKVLGEYVTKRIPLRRHFGNDHRKKKSRKHRHNKKKIKKDTSIEEYVNAFTENNYKSIRDNVENINKIIRNLDIGLSSSETSAFEYEVGEDVHKTNNVKEKHIKTKPKKTDRNEVHIFRTDNDQYNNPMNDEQMRKVTPNIEGIIHNLERVLGVTDKSSVSTKSNSIQFRFGNIGRFINKEYTVMSSSHAFMTRVVQKRIPYDKVNKSQLKKHKSSKHNDNDHEPKLVTEISKNLVHDVSNSQIKKEKEVKLKIKPHTNKLRVIDISKSTIKMGKDEKIKTYLKNHPLFDLIHKYPLPSQIRIGLKNKLTTNPKEVKTKGIARHLLQRKPSYSERLKTISPLKVITRFSHQVSKHTPKTTINILKLLRNGYTRIPNVQKKFKTTITQQNTPKRDTTHKLKGKGFVHKKIKVEESDDSYTDTEYSSESFAGNPPKRKRKYKELKRKYNILKRISQQILAQNMASVKHKQKPILRESVNVKHKNKATVPEDIYNEEQSKTTEEGRKKIKINNINLFLNDYEGKIEFESDSQETLSKSSKLIDYRDIIRKSFPLNITTDNSVNVTATDYSDAEKELKRNIYDAIRHIDFVNNNASRRNNDVQPMVGAGSHETDVEAVLKTNIYKAVKKLLKTS